MGEKNDGFRFNKDLLFYQRIDTVNNWTAIAISLSK